MWGRIAASIFKLGVDTLNQPTEVQILAASTETQLLICLKFAKLY